MLLEDIALVEELGISICPSYLIDNQILIRGIAPMGFKEIYQRLEKGGDTIEKK